jgi:hypothetical protein
VIPKIKKEVGHVCPRHPAQPFHSRPGRAHLRGDLVPDLPHTALIHRIENIDLRPEVIIDQTLRLTDPARDVINRRCIETRIHELRCGGVQNPAPVIVRIIRGHPSTS